jgi:hypothetical protein
MARQLRVLPIVMILIDLTPRPVVKATDDAATADAIPKRIAPMNPAPAGAGETAAAQETAQ